jgi:hypothetical protein
MIRFSEPVGSLFLSLLESLQLLRQLLEVDSMFGSITQFKLVHIVWYVQSRQLHPFDKLGHIIRRDFRFSYTSSSAQISLVFKEFQTLLNLTCYIALTAYIE